jgi:hypothetical protein
MQTKNRNEELTITTGNVGNERELAKRAAGDVGYEQRIKI